jgi:hypothetical protein
VAGNINQKIKRQEQLEQGMFDGRFRKKVVQDKKKKENKTWARKKY